MDILTQTTGYGYIYKTTLPNGEFYVGKHKSGKGDKYYYGSGTRITNYIRKHGRANIKVEILEWFPNLDSLNEAEIRYIELLNPSLNLAPGGAGGGAPGVGKKAWATRVKNGTTAVWNKGMKMDRPAWNKGLTGYLHHTEANKKIVSEKLRLVAAKRSVEEQHKSTYLGHHTRWHVMREIINKECMYCGE